MQLFSTSSLLIPITLKTIINPEIKSQEIAAERNQIKSQKIEHSFELLKRLNFPFKEKRSN